MYFGLLALAILLITRCIVVLLFVNRVQHLLSHLMGYQGVLLYLLLQPQWIVLQEVLTIIQTSLDDFHINCIDLIIPLILVIIGIDSIHSFVIKTKLLLQNRVNLRCGWEERCFRNIRLIGPTPRGINLLLLLEQRVNLYRIIVITELVEVQI